MPVADLVSNWAYMVIAALAWNLKAWYGLLVPNRERGRELVKMEFRRFLNAGHGDLYEYITSTESLLHERIRKVLVAEFGKAEPGWWRKGIPEKIRLDCRAAQEKDTEGDPDPFAYTTLIHLREILDRQWQLFQDRLPKDIVTNKKEFLHDLETLNGIRNRVMHPTRLHLISDHDFEFAREMHRRLRAEAWRKPPGPKHKRN